MTYQELENENTRLKLQHKALLKRLEKLVIELERPLYEPITQEG